MNAAVRLVEVRVPDMGNFKDVAVIDVLVKPGESIETEAPLVTLETEKATMDVPSTAGGVIEKIHVAKGGTVSTGDLIATVRAAAEPAAGATADPPMRRTRHRRLPPPRRLRLLHPHRRLPRRLQLRLRNRQQQRRLLHPSRLPRPLRRLPAPARARSVATPEPTAAKLSLPPINEPGFSQAHAGPSVRKFARELGVDLTRVKGSGFKGRITHEDVKGFVKTSLATPAPATARAPAGGGGGLPVIPAIDFSLFGPVETKPLSRIQKISGPRLHASWVNIPHVTQFDEADITDLEATRNKLKEKASQAGLKLTPLAFIVRACVKALQEFPQFNASLDPDGHEPRSEEVLQRWFRGRYPERPRRSGRARREPQRHLRDRAQPRRAVREGSRG